MCLICNVYDGPKEWLICNWCGKQFNTIFQFIHQHNNCDVDIMKRISGDAKARLAKLNNT